MNILDIFKTIAIIAGAVFAFSLGAFKAKNKKLQEDLEEKDSTINTIKDNEKIKEANSTMSKSDLINGL